MMLAPSDAAQRWLCPLARTFSRSPAHTHCIGPDCALWRYEPITTAHPKWREAVGAKAAELGERAPFPKAAAYVAANKEALGLVPTRGFCGAGGQP